MHEFVWFQLLFDWVAEHNVHMLHTSLVVIIITIISIFAYFKLRKTEKRLIPEPKGSLTNTFEVAVEQILSLVEGVVGEKYAPKYFPLIGALFIYIFLSNILTILPGFLPPTANINTTAACGLTVFIYYNYVGIREYGLAYFKHFLGPVIWLGPLLLIIELISHVVRPISLSLRLFGNMTGDHMVLGIFADLTPLIVPVAFLALGTFVAFIQAFVFSLLSLIYVGLAVEHADH